MNSHYEHSPLLDTAYVLKGNTLIHYDDDNVTEVDVNKMNTNYVQRKSHCFFTLHHKYRYIIFEIIIKTKIFVYKGRFTI